MLFYLITENRILPADHIDACLFFTFCFEQKRS